MKPLSHSVHTFLAFIFVFEFSPCLCLSVFSCPGRWALKLWAVPVSWKWSTKQQMQSVKWPSRWMNQTWWVQTPAALNSFHFREDDDVADVFYDEEISALLQSSKNYNVLSLNPPRDVCCMSCPLLSPSLSLCLPLISCLLLHRQLSNESKRMPSKKHLNIKKERGSVNFTHFQLKTDTFRLNSTAQIRYFLCRTVRN